MISDHLSDATIQALVDDELPETLRAAAEAHLASCAQCREAVASLASVAETVAETAPEDCHFCASGQFWDRLSCRLSRVADRESPYAVMALIPPLLLGAAGLAIWLISWVVTIVTLLTWAGVIPPLGGLLADTAALHRTSLHTPILLRWFLDAVVALAGTIRSSSANWPSAARSIVRFGLVQGLLSLILAITVALFAVWAACMPDCQPTGGGTAA